MEPYYYQTLSKAEQSSYQAMQAGLQAFAALLSCTASGKQSVDGCFHEAASGLSAAVLCRDISISLLSRFQKCRIDSCVSF